MEIVFLGSGSGVPLPRGDRCAQCRSVDPRDRRFPSALLIYRRILIDAGPSVTALLSTVGLTPNDITAVLLTHRHRDAAGGVSALPADARVIFPRAPGVIAVERHRFEAVAVPHAGQTWGYLIDGVLAYFSDYRRIEPALPALRRARIAVLDGSGWQRSFPSHEPMTAVIPAVKRLRNLKRVLFTHVGHTGFHMLSWNGGRERWATGDSASHTTACG